MCQAHFVPGTFGDTHFSAMFTGIVRCTARVQSLSPTSKGKRLTVKVEKSFPRLKLGESFAVNGVCLSVIRNARRLSPRALSFDVIPETLKRSNLGGLSRGDRVNLEPALKYGDHLSGHYVQGHVEAKGKLIATRRDRKKGVYFKISYPRKIKAALIPKGYIAVDGVSLTIGEVRPHYFTVYLIPYTLHSTNLNSKKRGDSLNLETDILLRTKHSSAGTFRYC